MSNTYEHEVKALVAKLIIDGKKDDVKQIIKDIETMLIETGLPQKRVAELMGVHTVTIYRRGKDEKSAS